MISNLIVYVQSAYGPEMLVALMGNMKNSMERESLVENPGLAFWCGRSHKYNNPG
jgi:hypothetical protein